MDVDVDVLGVDIKINEVWHLLALGNQAFEGRHDRLVEIRMPHVSAINKEVLLGAFLAGTLGFAHKAMNGTNGCFHVQGQQVLVDAFANDVHDALAKATGTKVEHLRAIAAEGEGHLGINKCDALESREDVVELSGVRLQKLAAGGNIVKEVLDHEIGTLRAGTCLLANETRSGNRQVRAYLLATLASLELHLGHGGYRRQRLTTEAHGMEVEEVVGLAYLRRGMALKGEARIGLRHALTVVDDLDGRAARVDHQHVNACGTGVDGVFHQFLDNRRRALDNLAGSYLVGH